MNRLFSLLFLFLPLLAVSQQTADEHQSKKTIEALQRLSTQYDIQRVAGPDAVVVEKDKKSGIVSLDGRIIQPLRYDWIYRTYGSNLLMLWLDNKACFADCNGNIVIPDEGYDFEEAFGADDAPTFTNGMLSVSRNDKYGIIDTTGRVVIPLKFNGPVYFDTKLSLLFASSYDYETYDSHYAIMNLDGDTLMQPDDYCRTQYEGIIAVKNGGTWNFYDTNKRKALKGKYDNIMMRGRLISVQNKGHWYLVDASGKRYYKNIGKHIDDTVPFYQSESGLIWGFRGDGYGAVDMQGRTIIPFKEEQDIFDETIPDRIVMMADGYMLMVYDRKGTLLGTYESAFYPIEDYYGIEIIPVNKDGKTALLDIRENRLLPFRYEYLYYVDNEHFEARLNDGSVAFIDNKGNIIVKAPFEWIVNIGEGIYKFVIKSLDDPEKEIQYFVDEYGNNTYNGK
ncbi:MAG: WG repeat-containing protein [Bacteroidales bacterium]|nr:WG repeat-containing protein [Bacteroidales bacterium]